MVFAFSTLIHVLANGWLRDREGPDTYIEATHLALSLATGEGFQNPFALEETGPTAHVAPGYPFLYAGVLRVFGTGPIAAWAVRLLTIGANALMWSLMVVFARVWKLPDRVGLIAAGVGGALPIPGSCFKWESVLAGLVLVGCACFAARCLSNPRSSRPWIESGLLWGVGFLITPVFLSTWLGWLLLTVYFVKKPRGPIAFLAILPLAVIAPWIARNDQVFHTFVLIRDNLGIELASSNSDCATAWAKRNARSGCLALTHPSVNPDLLHRLRQAGEISFNAEQMKRALAWIETNPARFAELSAQRLLWFWLPPADREEGTFAALNALLVGALTLLSLPGLWMLCRKHPRCGLFCASVLLLYPLVYYFLQLDLRYRYPILWITVLGVAWGISDLIERRSHNTNAIF